MRTVRLAVPVLAVLTFTSLLILPEAARATQLADLTVSSVPNPPKTARVGAEIKGRDTVKNTGPAAARTSFTRYYLSLDARKGAGDKRLGGSRAVPPLLPGKSSGGTANLTIPSSTPPGSYFLLACADDTRKIAERNDGNNCRASSGKIAVAAPYAPGYTGNFSGSMQDTGWHLTWSWDGTATFVWVEQQENGATFPDYYSLSSGSVEVTISGSYPVDGGTCTISSPHTMYTFGVDNGQNVQSGLSWLFVDNINDAYRVFGLEPVDANNHWWQITVTWTCPEGTTSYDWDVLNDHPFVPTGSDYVPVSSDGSLEGSSTAFSTSQQSYQFQWDFDKQA